TNNNNNNNNNIAIVSSDPPSYAGMVSRNSGNSDSNNLTGLPNFGSLSNPILSNVTLNELTVQSGNITAKLDQPSNVSPSSANDRNVDSFNTPNVTTKPPSNTNINGSNTSNSNPREQRLSSSKHPR